MASTNRTGSSTATATALTPTLGVRDAERSSYSPNPSITTYYAMRAVDPDAPTLTYRTWVVYGTPDTNGSRYTGTKSGNSSLTKITVVAQWTVSN